MVAHDEQFWLIQPLLDAGLDVEEIRSLVSRLGFEAVTTPVASTAACLTRLVDDRPPEVRAAWIEVVQRMIAGPGAACAPEPAG